jgi:hypothetical protein
VLSKRALRYRREKIVCARTKSCDHVYRLVIDWDEYIDFCFSRKLFCSHIFFSLHRDLSSSWGALDECNLQKIWLDDLLDGRDLFAYDGCERRESDRFRVECMYQVREELTIQDIESSSIDSESIEYSLTLSLRLYRFPDSGVVPEDLRIAIGDTRCPSRSQCDRHDCLIRDSRESEDRERSLHDLREIDRRVEVEFHHIAESVSERIRQARQLGRRTDQGEPRDIHPDTRRSCSRADHDVDRIVLHRGVEDLLDLWSESVYLVDEEYISFTQTREE